MAISVAAPTAGTLPILGAVVIGTINSGGTFEQYVGPSYKAPVRVATTVAGTLATSFANGQTVDGIVLATGDRILIKNQVAAATNGIYVVAASGAPARASDMDSWSEVPGSVVGVLVGTTNADTAWICTSDAGGTIDVTAMNFSAFGTSLATPIAANIGGTGVANNVASTITISGNFGTTLTVSGITSLTLPTTGTVATLAGAEALSNKTLSVTDGDLNIRGVTSTNTGISIGSGANTLRLVAAGSQWLVIGSNGNGNVTRTDGGPFMVNKSGVAMYANSGGVVFDHFTDGASTSTDGTEDTLYTDTLPSNGLSNNGEKLHGFYQLSVVGHAVSTDRIRVYFGGTAIFDSAAVNFPLSSVLTIRFEIIRVSSTVIRAAVSVTTTTATVLPYSVYTEVTGLTLSSTQVIKLTDISTGTNSAAGDVTAKLGGIWWFPTSNITGA